MTAKAKLEVIASRLEARVPSWGPALPGCKAQEKPQDSQSWRSLLVGRGQGTKLEANATRLQEAQKYKKHKTAKQRVGGQSSG